MNMAARCVAHPSESAEASCARCGDFICTLCGPIEPVAMCARCVLKGTLDWEERGGESPLRAFARTWFLSVRHPAQLARGLHGQGHIGAALTYAAIVAAISSLPLALSFSFLLFSAFAPDTQGILSMGVLGLSVMVAIGSVVVTSLVPILLFFWALFLCGVLRWQGTPCRLDRTVRVVCYGASLLALPLVGLPLAVAQELWLAYLLGHSAEA